MAISRGVMLPSRDLPRRLRGRGGAALVLTCEHASYVVPERLGDLGLSEGHRRDHIGWDLGAGVVTDELSIRLRSPAVVSSVSRLVIDCNRSLDDHDLIPEGSHGVTIPANQRLGDTEFRRRVCEYYDPFHDEVDRMLAASAAARLLSLHSFTPHYDDRGFDIGVLFDDHEAQAEGLADGLRRSGFSVRMNEPYSGLDGLIFSAQSHGRRFGREYLELEINNTLLQDESASRTLARRIAGAVAEFAEIYGVDQ